MTTSNEPPEFYNNLPNLTPEELAALNLLAAKRAEEASSGGSNGGSYALQDLTNVSDTVPGSGQNNYPLAWNNNSQQWEASNNIAGVTIRKGVGANTQAIGSVCNSSGNDWIAQGLGASQLATTAFQFISQGNSAAGSNTSGSNFLAQGQLAAASNNGGGYFLAQGFAAAYLSTSGTFWQAQGVNAGFNNTTGSFWVAQGFRAGYSNTSGGNWMAQGVAAGESNTSGVGWSAQGRSAGYSNTTGSFWVAQGFEAGYFDTRSNVLNVGNSRSKSLICGDFANDCIYFGNVGPITSSANVPVPTAAVHAAASNTTRASLRIDAGVAPTSPFTGDVWMNVSDNSLTLNFPLVKIGSARVLADDPANWSAPTGTASKATFDTATVTLEELAKRVKALIDLIGAT